MEIGRLILTLVIAAVIAVWVILKPRWWSLSFPFWYALFPKGFLMLDIAHIPVVTMYRWICIVLFVSVMLRAAPRSQKWLRAAPLHIAMFAVLLSGLLSALGNVGTPDAGFLSTLNGFIEIIVPVSAFSYYFSKQDISKQRKLFRSLLIFYGAIALYAIAAFSINYNPYVAFMETTAHTGRIVTHTYAGTLRGLRAQGTISHPITFGAALAAILLTAAAIGASKKRLGKSPFRGYVGIASFVVIFLAILLTRSRSPLIFIGVACIFAVMISSLARSYIYMIAGGIAVFGGFLLIPSVHDAFLSVINIFDPSVGKAQYGSSLSMRSTQLTASLKYFRNAPILGNGMDAARNRIAAGTDSDLLNTESLAFNLLINQGLIGIIAYAFLFYSSFWTALRNSVDRNSMAWLVGYVAGYLVFVLSTGILDTMSIFLCLYSAVILMWRAGSAPRSNVKYA